MCLEYILCIHLIDEDFFCRLPDTGSRESLDNITDRARKLSGGNHDKLC